MWVRRRQDREEEEEDDVCQWNRAWVELGGQHAAAAAAEARATTSTSFGTVLYSSKAPQQQAILSLRSFVSCREASAWACLADEEEKGEENFDPTRDTSGSFPA